MPDANQADNTRGGIWVVPSVVGHALGGLCVGAVAGYQFLPHLVSFEKSRALGSLLGLNFAPEDMFWFPASVGAALGLAAGVVSGRISGARATRRAESLRQTALRRGDQFSSVDADLGAQLARDFSLHGAAISNVLRKEMPGFRVAVGDLAIARETGTGTDRETRWSTQTAAYYAADALRFPKFTLQPEGLGLKLLSSITGIEDIDFPSHPEFSRNYHLTAVHTENARRLFDDRLLESLSRHPGLHIESAQSSLLIYRPGAQNRAEEIEGFITETTEIFRLFEASARKLQQAPEVGLIPKVDARAAAEKMPGAVGKLLREILVTRAEVKAFVRQPPPRKVPANIRRYCDQFAPGMMLMIGGMFFLVGAGFSFGFWQAGKWDGALFGLLFVVVGGGVLLFLGRIRLSLVRLLRHGHLGVGRIENIESTGWSGPGGEVSRAKVRFQAAGESVQATCNIAGFAIERAQKLAAATKPAALLYDPANPQRFLLVDALLSVSPEYEE